MAIKSREECAVTCNGIDSCPFARCPDSEDCNKCTNKCPCCKGLCTMCEEEDCANRHNYA